jgi:hypothetical protein
MGLNLSAIWTPWIIFGVTSIVVVLVILILTIVEKVLDKKIKRKQAEEELFFKEKIEYLKSKENKPDEFLILFNEIALEVFKEALNLEKTPDYDEVARIFKKRGNIRASKFANKIQLILYSGGKIDKGKLDSLINELVTLINEFRTSSQKNELAGQITKFEDYVDTFLKKINNLKEEFNKFERVKESTEPNPKPVPEEPREPNLEVVPYKPEIIKHRKVKLSEKRAEKYKPVSSLDNLDRIKNRLKKNNLKGSSYI